MWTGTSSINRIVVLKNLSCGLIRIFFLLMKAHELNISPTKPMISYATLHLPQIYPKLIIIYDFLSIYWNIWLIEILLKYLIDYPFDWIYQGCTSPISSPTNTTQIQHLHTTPHLSMSVCECVQFNFSIIT